MRSSKSKVAVDAAGTNPSYLFEAHTHTNTRKRRRESTKSLTLERRRAKTLDLPVSAPPGTHALVCKRDGYSVLLGVSVSMSPHL